MLEISHAQWNSTFRCHRQDPSHRAFGYCSWKKVALETTIMSNGNWHTSVRPTEISGPVKVDHLQMVCSIWFLSEISGILDWMESARCDLSVTWVRVGSRFASQKSELIDEISPFENKVTVFFSRFFLIPTLPILTCIESRSGWIVVLNWSEILFTSKPVWSVSSNK